MRVLIIGNERSGRGRAVRESRHVHDGLRSVGIDSSIRLIGPQRPPVTPEDLAGLSCVVLCGGDGTLNHLLDALVAARSPIYHWPCGNENLFARQFAMKRNIGTLAYAIRTGATRTMDLGIAELEGRPPRRFAIMLSLGPDASIIHRLDAGPRRLPGHLAYLTPVFAEVIRPTIPQFDLDVDGVAIARGVRGMAVVANSRQYALRLDPARGAIVDDGLLDAVSLAFTSTVGWSTRLALCWPLGLSTMTPKSARGRVITIDCHEAPTPIQIDGESAGRSQRVRIDVEPNALVALMP